MALPLLLPHVAFVGVVDATSEFVIVTFKTFVTESTLQCQPVIFNFTLNAPALVYVWDGFCSVDVPPSPNCQNHSFATPHPKTLWSVKL